MGYEGKYTQVKEAVREIKRFKQEVYMPLIQRPDEAQVDFGYAQAKISGVLKKVGFLVMVLPHSDALFVMVFERELDATTEFSWKLIDAMSQFRTYHRLGLPSLGLFVYIITGLMAFPELTTKHLLGQLTDSKIEMPIQADVHHPQKFPPPKILTSLPKQTSLTTPKLGL
jgi:hypothetical protein